MTIAGGFMYVCAAKLSRRIRSRQRHVKVTHYASYAGAFALIVGTVSGLGFRDVNAAVLPVVTPVTVRADRLKLAFTGLENSPTKLRRTGLPNPSASLPTQ